MSEKAKVTKMWIDKAEWFSNNWYLCIAWDNGDLHSIVIHYPHSKIEVAEALLQAAKYLSGEIHGVLAGKEAGE